MLVVFLGAVSTASAQSFRLKAYQFSMNVNLEGKWTGWSDWKTSNIPIFVNFDESRIKILSKQDQDYVILDYIDADPDDNGESIIMKCVDKEGLMCHIRIRAQHHPKITQIYVEYKDIKIVYCVEDN